jgi:penicillin-binding protein 2
MNRDVERQKLFTRRTALLAGGKAVLLSALVGRLYYLQVVESENYRTLAEENRINLRLLAPPRGRIVDRLGRPLAVNRQNYQVVVVAEQANDIEATLDALGRIIDISDGERRRVLRDVGRKRKFVPVPVRGNLDWESVAQIEVNAPDLPGIAIDEGQSRHYLHGEDFAHVLGYVAPVSENEINGDPLLELPGFRIGKAGIEKVYDLSLRGNGGSSEVEVNAVGRVIRELNRKEGEPGTDITLTIDMDLQRLATQRLEGESGAAVVLDVRTGDVLALVSTPGFDPNAFNRGLSNEEWQALISNPRAPLANKAIAGQYAPGSTFKVAVALAGLEKGAINPNTTVKCWGRTRLGNAYFHCWKRGGHGPVQLHDALTQSCDVYFYEVAKRVGVDRISAMARRLGLGQTLGLDLPGERTGLLPTRDWKLATIGVPWQMGETLISGIGQGYVLATPLQLAVMTARIANGGRAVTPRIARGAPPPEGAEPEQPPDDLGLVPGHLQLVRAGMIDVVNGRRGTARASAIKEPGMEMAGKTGTSQVRRISKAEREAGVFKNEDLPWKRRDHALFVGYAPVDAPRYAVAVVIEHGGGGSKAAAPVARDILTMAQKLDTLRIADGGPEQSIIEAVPGRGDDGAV